VPVAQLAQVVQVVQVAHRVPVAQLVQAALAHVQVSVAHVRAVPQVAHRVAHRVQVSLVQVAAQPAAVVAESAAEPQVRSVRAAPAVKARLASQSVRNAKNSNSAAMRHHLVVQ